MLPLAIRQRARAFGHTLHSRARRFGPCVLCRCARCGARGVAEANGKVYGPAFTMYCPRASKAFRVQMAVQALGPWQKLIAMER